MGNGYFGLAQGMALTSMVCAIGPITGGAFNPAIGTMGPFLGRSASGVWAYWVAGLLGGALATACYRVQNFQDFEDQQEAQSEHKADKATRAEPGNPEVNLEV